MRKSVSWVTVSTSGELFMMVLTRAKGRLDVPVDGEEDILTLQILQLAKNWNKLFFKRNFTNFDKNQIVFVCSSTVSNEWALGGLIS